MTVDNPTRARVLIVDDHQMLAESLRHHLDSEPDLVCVALAGTLAAAEELVASHKPDVLLLDHRLPDGEGVAALPRLLRRHETMSVVVMTASTTDDVLLAAVQAGVSGFVSKSRSLRELTAAVRAAAAGEAVISPELLARLLPRLTPAGADAAAASASAQDLTSRELEVLGLLALGLTNAAIASRLVVSVHTVRNHVANLSTKLGAHSKLEALSVAVRRGILPVPDDS